MINRLLLPTLVIVFFAGMTVQAQGTQARPSQKTSLRLVGGFAWPLGHKGFTEYWQPGPNGEVQFLVSVNRRVWLGFNLDASAYWFRAGTFALQNPGTPGQNKAVAHTFAGIVLRTDFTPGRRLGLYGGVETGAVIITPAEYYEDRSGVRVTYFRIPSSTNLGLGVFLGLELAAGRRVAIDLEPRILYVHNNPDVGLVTALRTGIRFIW
jgi:hypothetical protein